MRTAASAALAASLWLAWPARAAAPAAAAPSRFVICADATEPPTLDAHKEFSERNHTLIQQFFEGLVRFDPDGRIEPALAVSWERKDPLRMRFRLREGVRFHNGEPFDAHAVKFSVERILDPATAFPGIGLLNSLAKAEVVDDRTVDIVTHYPDGILLRRLAHLFLIAPPRYLAEVGEKAFAGRPVGTGPFRFKSWNRKHSILLEANRDYWMKDAPQTDELEFRFISKKDQLRELFAGRLDLLTDVPGTKTLEVQRHPRTEVRKGKTYYTATAALRFNRGPLADRRVRRALNHAIDRNALIRYDLLGNGTPLASMSMPGEEGHDPALQPYEYDPKKAAALLAEAGYPQGFTLKATVKDGVERTARVLAGDWKRIGVDLQIDLMTEGEMPERFKDPKYDLAIGDLPDPLGHVFFIQSLVIYSKSPFSLARDERFDAKLEEMVSTIDDSKREALARDLDRYVHSEALSLFTYQRLKIYGVKKGVRFKHYVTGTPYFHSAGGAR